MIPQYTFHQFYKNSTGLLADAFRRVKMGWNLDTNANEKYMRKHLQDSPNTKYKKFYHDLYSVNSSPNLKLVVNNNNIATTVNKTYVPPDKGEGKVFVGNPFNVQAEIFLSSCAPAYNG